MPRLTFSLPKYSLHKSSGNAKVRLNGKSRYLGKYGTPESKEAYAKFLAAIPKPGTEVIVVASPGTVPLIGEAVLKYQTYAEKYYSRDGVPTGEHVTITCALRPFNRRFAELPVNGFKPDMLELVQEDMIKLGRSRSYINKSCNIIRRFFKWCVKKGFATGETLAALRAVDGLKRGRSEARETAPIGPVDDQAVEAVLAIVSELVADVAHLMRFTGMRPGEALAMTAAEIDRTDPTLWVFKPDQHKTAHHGLSRTVFLGPNAIDIVRRYLVKAGDGGKLFPITRNALRRAISRGCLRRSSAPGDHFLPSSRRSGPTNRKPSSRPGTTPMSGTRTSYGTLSGPRSAPSSGSRRLKCCLAIPGPM